MLLETHRQTLFIYIALTLIILCLSLFLLTDPILQNPDYHILADQRDWLSIPNFANVASNLPFALIGIVGILYCLEAPKDTLLSWMVFFIGLVLVAAGSCYYHWNPNNQSLFWDRLPMTICFMALLTALISETSPRLPEKIILAVCILLGISSVIYWQLTGDLRFYGLIQFGTLAAMPLILFFNKGQYTHRQYLLYGFLFYLFAKIQELTDSPLYTLSHHLISGHSAKHLCAAAGVYCIYLMLRKRQAS